MSYHLKEISNKLDLLSSEYDNYLLIEDFNAEQNEPAISDFLWNLNTINIIKGKTCFKNPENKKCIRSNLYKQTKGFPKFNCY